MRYAIVAALLLGGVQSLAWGQTAPVGDPVGAEPAADLPVADLSNPDLIYDPETDTYYDPQTGDVFAAPAPLTPDPNAPSPASQSAQSVPTNFGPLQTGIYAGAGMNTLDFKAYGIQGIVGYDFNEYFGAEVQIGLGIADDEEVVEGVGIPLGDADGNVARIVPETVLTSSGYDASFAAFGVLRAPVSDKIELFARAGVHSTGLGGQIAGRARNPEFGENNLGGLILFDYDARGSGFAVGGGAQYNFGDYDLQAIRVDFTYLDFGDLDEAEVSRFNDKLPVDGDILNGGIRFIDSGTYLSVSLMQRF